MKRILHLVSSIRGEGSYSLRLGRAIIEKVQDAHPGSIVDEINLGALNIPHLTPAILQSFFTPGDQLTPEDKESIRFSNESVAQLLAADIIVIGAPLYNFTIPSSLKAWLDHITRAGMTFRYGENGPVGLVTGKKVYIAMASGGVYSEGPAQGADFVVPYLQFFLGFLGMTDITVYRAEGVKVPGIMEHTLENAIASIRIEGQEHPATAAAAA